MSDEMRDRVAYAITRRMTQFPCTDRDCAQAAMEAMREPTKAMIAAGHEGSKCSMESMAHAGGVPPYIVEWVWPAMIDEALK